MSNLRATVEVDSEIQGSASETPPIPETTTIVQAPVTATKDAADEPVEKTGRAFLWLRRGDQLIVWLLVTSLLILLGIHWLRLSRWGSAPVELRSQQSREYYYSLDINTASWVEWAQLDGIGEKLARRIVADREEHGPFLNPDNVSRVKGVGPKLMEKIRTFLKGGAETTDGKSSVKNDGGKIRTTP